MTNDHEPSLWELLGLEPRATVPTLSDDAWNRVVHVATDPDTPPVGAELIPVDEPDELEVDPVDVDIDLDDDAPVHHGHSDPSVHDAGYSDQNPENHHLDDHELDDHNLDPYGHHDPGVTGDADLG